MYTPLISIIVPIYNLQGYISDTLDSMLAQTYTHWECICVNDGSTDGTATILEEYATRDSRIRIAHQKNAGVSVARNTGLALMKGEYFTFCDGDDLYRNNILERYVEMLRAHDLDVIELSLEFFSSDGKVYWTPFEVEMISLEYSLVERGKSMPSLLKILPSVCNKLIKRTVWEEERILFTPGLAIGEDRVFFTKLYYSVRSYCSLPDKLMAYRQDRSDSVMTSSPFKRIVRGDIQTFSEIFKYWNKKGRWDEIRHDMLELYFNVMRHRLAQLKAIDVLLVWGRIVYLFHRMYLKGRKQGEKMLYLRYASFYKKVLLKALSIRR